MLPSESKILFQALKSGFSAIENSLKDATEQRIHATRDASETARQDCKDIQARINALRVPEIEKADARAYRDKQYRLQKWLNRGTWLAFLAAAIYAGIAAFQLHQMKRANDLTRQALDNGDHALSETLTEMEGQIEQMSRLADNAKAQADRTRELAATASSQLRENKSIDRAFVFVRSIMSTPYPKTKEAQDNGFTILANWANSGSTPTKGLKVRSGCGVTPFAEGISQVLSIGPKGEEAVKACQTSEDQITAFNARTHSWDVWGRATYRDAFGEYHLTEFCKEGYFEYLHAPTIAYRVSTAECLKFNCTDEECEDYKDYMKPNAMP